MADQKKTTISYLGLEDFQKVNSERLVSEQKDLIMPLKNSKNRRAEDVRDMNIVCLVSRAKR
jgi:hypothetical protein